MSTSDNEPVPKRTTGNIPELPLIIVPYRNRDAHLAEFIPAMRAYLPGVDIVVVEQVDDKPFNRAKLFNVALKENSDYSYYVFHDVDKIPVNVDYSFPKRPTQLAASQNQLTNYFGGVTMFNNWDIKYVNGFSNDFWDWGGEDNEMFLNTTRLLQIDYRQFVFKDLPHQISGIFNSKAWRQSQIPRKKREGLQTCQYTLISREQKEGYTFLKVEL